MAEKTFTVEVTMQERWIPHFMSMLQRMGRNGEIGQSEFVSIYADGDGDFQPKFKPDITFEKVGGVKTRDGVFFDAG
jgi:hypothetical protein